MDYNVLVGGAAGQGVDTLAKLLEQILKKNNFEIFSNKDYMSRVRGGHNFTQIRFGESPLYSQRDDLDLVIALDMTTVNNHRARLSTSGKLLGDVSLRPELDADGIWLPLKQTAKALGSPLLEGTVAAGAALKLFALQLASAEPVLESIFQAAIRASNHQALEAGFNMVESVFPTLEPVNEHRIMLNGNQAIGLGALAAGCCFYAAYPMTPSTGIMNYLAAKMAETKIVVEQAEDEIAAINMALGASYAGVRSMTGTSGGGFSLMVEALGLAGITETPLVIAEIQRPGPATGLPTRTEQGDLKFVISAAQGEFPRMVIALRNPQDAFYQTARAFNLAEQFQIPVILLGDQYVGDYYQTIPPYDFSKITIERHLSTEATKPYRRYALTESGISPRLVPGRCAGEIVLADSDEHTEFGHITESATVRNAMVRKRLQKLKLLEAEVEEPWFFGQSEPEVLLVAWGSTAGPVREAVETMRQAGISVGALVFGDVYPFPSRSLKQQAATAKHIINVEQNATGQLAALMRDETLIACTESVLKYDGRAMSGGYIVSRVKEVL
ncbi:MAG: 2-oxoacid:acceptor oxidoreductase subunit alpha [Peptococcaceae bacterium]|nr:2-oxoacid:acceptor oxidoreductase subunit alpha [Peptococcaceae bacterium]